MRNILTALFFCFLGSPSNAQVLEDSLSKALILSSLDKVYNFEFEEAEQIIKPVLTKYKNHPASYLLKANMLYWQFMPIENHPKQMENYLKILQECKEVAIQLNKNKGEGPETIFYLLSASGFLTRGYHYQTEYFKAGLEARKAYKYMKAGFNLSEANSDFLYSNGLYKYYREAYPENHPQIKPIIYFFTDGNKEEGMADLRRAGKEALFTRVESLYLLSEICLKYESKNQEALSVSEELLNKYPENPSFLLNHIEALLANNLLTNAKELNAKLLSFSGYDYKTAYFVFEGRIAFEQNKVKVARNFFNRAISLKGEGRRKEDLLSQAFLGLGKSYIRLNAESLAKENLKKCLDIAKYKYIIEEAEFEIDKL